MLIEDNRLQNITPAAKWQTVWSLVCLNFSLSKLLVTSRDRETFQRGEVTCSLSHGEWRELNCKHGFSLSKYLSFIWSIFLLAWLLSLSSTQKPKSTWGLQHLPWSPEAGWLQLVLVWTGAIFSTWPLPSILLLPTLFPSPSLIIWSSNPSLMKCKDGEAGRIKSNSFTLHMVRLRTRKGGSLAQGHTVIESKWELRFQYSLSPTTWVSSALFSLHPGTTQAIHYFLFI